MAGGMKGVYVGLGAVAIVGTGIAVMAMGSGGTLPSGPVDVASIEAGRSFEGYSFGNEAPVEIVEFGDFECPACRQQWVLTVHDVKQRLVQSGRAHFVFRDFPLDMHPNARAAHHAAACMADQDLFWPMHDKLFELQPEWAGRPDAQKRFRRMASDVGGDVDAYNECMSEGRHRGRIEASVQAGLAVGVGSTPTYLIGGQVYTAMSYDDLARIVDSLAAASEQ